MMSALYRCQLELFKLLIMQLNWSDVCDVVSKRAAIVNEQAESSAEWPKRGPQQISSQASQQPSKPDEGKD